MLWHFSALLFRSMKLRAHLGRRKKNASASFHACVGAEQELRRYCVSLALLAFVLMLVLSCRLRIRKLVL